MNVQVKISIYAKNGKERLPGEFEELAIVTGSRRDTVILVFDGTTLEVSASDLRDATNRARREP